MKPNLDKIIQDNLDKAKFQSKLKPSLPKNTGWLDQYARGGTYISGKALATQFGQYDEGGEPEPKLPNKQPSESTGVKINKPFVSNIPKLTPEQLKAQQEKQDNINFLKQLREDQTKYTPSQGVNNLKAGFAAADLATTPVSGTPWGAIANYSMKGASSVGDLYTGIRYLADGQIKNGLTDLVEAAVDWIPLRKGKNVINLSKTNNLPGIYNKMSKVDKSINTGLKTLKVGAVSDDLLTPFLAEHKLGGDISIPDLNNNKQFKNNNMAKYGGWLSKYEDGSVVDYLSNKNQDFSYSNRKELAKKLGIENYEGTADQNLQMLDKLKQSENVVTGKRYVKPPAQGIYFEDGVDVRTPDVPQREVPKVKEKQKVVNKIPEYDPFGFIKEAVKNNNTPTKSPLPQPAPTPPAKKVNDSSWYNRVGDWFGGMENTLNKIKENTLGRPGFIPDNNNNKPKVVEGTKKDSRYLESGMIEDKNKGEMYVIKNGKVVKTMPILTGLNKNGEVNDKDYQYLHDHPEESKKLKATPTGTYVSVPNADLYGYPGFDMNPISAFGQPAPKARALAQHVIYGAGPKGSHGYDPQEAARRTKIMQGPGENRVGSFGCTNMYGQDINCLTGQLFPKGDTTIVVDSRRPTDQSFLKNTYGIKKMGGEPCYNCGGMYNKGGQTNWLDKYK